MQLADLGVEFVENFIFARNTTYGLGGGALGAFFPKNREEVELVVSALLKANQKFTVLGCGSNVLASDSGYDGVIISTKKLTEIYLTDNNLLYCESGVTVAKLLKFCRNNGVGGLEYLAGIPATVGGLALMNGGIAQRHIGDDIEEIEFFDGKYRNFTQKQCHFTNKHSTMRDIIGIIYAAKIKVSSQPKEITQKKIAETLKNRAYLPKGKSCGCVFKNGEDYSAGKLIDNCGLKGLRAGLAEVSPAHANFIINRGNSAADVYKLIHIVKRAVKNMTGIDLVEEVVYIGDFNDTFG